MRNIKRHKLYNNNNGRWSSWSYLLLSQLFLLGDAVGTLRGHLDGGHGTVVIDAAACQHLRMFWVLHVRLVVKYWFHGWCSLVGDAANRLKLGIHNVRKRHVVVLQVDLRCFHRPVAFCLKHNLIFRFFFKFYRQS